MKTNPEALISESPLQKATGEAPLVVDLAALDAGQPTRFSLRAYWRLLRPHQWIKNLLVFVPLLATIRLSHLSLFVPATLAFISFSLVASAGYVVNDLWDLAADRTHPRKRKRPLASGSVSLRTAVVLIPALFAAGLAVGLTISFTFAAVLSLYAVSTCVYTFWLKRIPILDTLILGGLYTLRILGGAAAIDVVPSEWLLAFSMFFFLSLALAKRHSELVEMQEELPFGPLPGRQYWRSDLVTLSSQGSAAGYAAVLVLALFIDSSNVRAEYNQPELIWLVCPLVLYWINKLWLNSQRGQIREDPVVWAMRNRVSRGIGALSVAILLLAKWLPHR